MFGKWIILREGDSATPLRIHRISIYGTTHTGNTSRTTPTHPLATTGPNEQIVRHCRAGTELQNRIHPVGAREDSGCDAADDRGVVVALDLGGGFEVEELEACSMR